ncbi:MAG: hypothetical protein RLZZ370_1482 [Bacteroidota bacterium]|jgi:hypothetical protein
MKSLFLRCLKPLPVLFLLGLGACSSEEKTPKLVDQQLLYACQQALDECIIFDHFPPLQASRNYVYPHIAAFEALVPFFPEYRSLHGQLNDFPKIQPPDTSKTYNLDVVLIAAFEKTGSALVYSRYLDTFRQKRFADLKQRMSASAFERSRHYGEAVADAILAWAKKDGFPKTRNAPQYTPKNDRGTWQPTTPDFARAIEPNWGTHRTLLLPNSGFFVLPNPIPFDSVPGSDFMNATKEVLAINKSLTKEQSDIAWYWDDNPNMTHHFGHATINTFKLSPPGHWMGITRYATQKKGTDLMQTSEAFTQVAIALYDALVACWEEKYRWEYIRPETVIRRYLEPNWSPLIQTPSFPEYPSGHATASAASSRVLTGLFGAYPFTDSTVMQFGMQARSFEHFIAAADEAAMSRLYGGIHFRNGNEAGKILGAKVAASITEKLRTRK